MLTLVSALDGSGLCERWQWYLQAVAVQLGSCPVRLGCLSVPSAMLPATGDHHIIRASLQSDGHTCVMVAVEGRLAAAVSLFDPIKPEARGVVTALHTAGLQCHLLTGDNRCAQRLLGHIAGWLEVLRWSLSLL